MNRGDVVEVHWPYSELSGTKGHPAVVVRADFLDEITDDVALVKITGRRFAVRGTEVTLGPAAEPASGLNKVCYACCYEFLTRDEAVTAPSSVHCRASPCSRSTPAWRLAWACRKLTTSSRHRFPSRSIAFLVPRPRG